MDWEDGKRLVPTIQLKGSGNKENCMAEQLLDGLTLVMKTRQQMAIGMADSFNMIMLVEVVFKLSARMG